MVRLGEICNHKGIRVFGSFNSSMVRLGEIYASAYRLNHIRFNSSMVRLGEPIPAHKIKGFVVSIPVWCD